MGVCPKHWTFSKPYSISTQKAIVFIGCNKSKSKAIPVQALEAYRVV
jgi:hypothetical protein